MKRAKTIRSVAWVTSLLLIGSGLWMIYSTPTPRKAPTLPTNLKQTQPSVPSSRVAADLNRPASAAPVPSARTAGPARATKPDAHQDALSLIQDALSLIQDALSLIQDALSLIQGFDKLFANTPARLSAGEVKDLIAQRQKAKQDLLDALSGLGPGGARDIAEAFQQTDSLLDKQNLTQALAKLRESETIPVLKELLSRESGLYEKKELILQTLTGNSQQDIRQSAAQALAMLGQP